MKLFEVTTVVIGSFFVAWLGYGYFFESRIEQPAYKSVTKNKNYEIRIYEKITIASHLMTNESQSFRELFKYIDGKNNKTKKIPMTAPVIEYNNEMMFVLPKEITDIPKPNNENIKITQIGPLKVAVKTFSGSAKNYLKVKTKLINELKRDGVKSSSKFYLSQYNSPWVFPLLRKNEVWVELN